MNKKEFQGLMSKHGIKNKEFIEDVWMRMGGFGKLLEKKNLEPAIRLFIKKTSKNKLRELGRS